MGAMGSGFGSGSIIPDGAKLKTFWEKPEGKVGAVVIAMILAAFCYGMWAIDWALIFQNTIFFFGTLAVMGGVIGLALSKSFRSLLDNTFRMVMREATNLIVKTKPLDILKNNIDRMEEDKEEFDEALSGVAGSKQTVENAIRDNTNAIEQAKGRWKGFMEKAGKAQSQAEKDSWTLRAHSQESEAGRRADSNKRLQKTLAQITQLYEWLTKWQSFWEYKIGDTKLQFDGLKKERDTTLKAYRGMRLAQRLIKGDPQEVKNVDMALEFLAQDNAEKMGFMKDFTRQSKQFLDVMDVDQGVQAEAGEKIFADLEKKMSESGLEGPRRNPDQLAQTLGVPPQPKSERVSEIDYLDLK